MRRGLTLALAALAFLPAAAEETAIRFDGGWTEQRFSLFSSNDYEQAGEVLRVGSDGTVSLLWTPLPEALWDGRRASWRWAAEAAPPPTDLTLRGGDDRTLALYFLFMPRAQAEAARDADVTDLLDAPQARVLMYVLGGDHPRGASLPTPYLGARGRTLVLRPAGTGAWSENVDLAEDHRRVFGAEPEALVGLAVSSDSDDTDTTARATLSELRLR